MKADTQPARSELSDPQPGPALLVTGRVARPLAFGMAELRALEAEEVENLLVICGSGTPKGCIARCRGVHLEQVIGRAEVIKEEANDTKKMFIVVSALDGFKVVFSWQEIFNTPIGGGVLILLEREGKALDVARGELELISTEDYFTGARYVKGLNRIEVLAAV